MVAEMVEIEEAAHAARLEAGGMGRSERSGTPASRARARIGCPNSTIGRRSS
jgi:hypothetical protein